MTIKLINISFVQPLGILEDVLVQVNELIFPTDFYVLDMEDKRSRKGSTLILGRPFLMTSRIKIDVHARTLSMEFGDHLVQFNIFEAMKHPIEDHSLFCIDLINELVEENLQLNTNNDDTLDFVGDTDIFDCLGYVTAKVDCNELREVRDLSNSENGITDLADLGPTTNSRLKLISSKLRSKWDGPFVITHVFPYDVVEVKDENTNNTFQVSFSLISQIKGFSIESAPTLVPSQPDPDQLRP
ncbi:hypothetical protein CR513_52336, partial [Mucuna pruriens]